MGFAGLAKFYGPDQNMTTQEVLPSLGGGLRFMVDTKQRIAVRADFAWGKNGETGFYFGLTEAF